MSRPFDPDLDRIKLYLQFGSNPSPTNGTDIVVEENGTDWNLFVDTVDDTEVSYTKISLILMRFTNEEFYFSNFLYLF